MTRGTIQGVLAVREQPNASWRCEPGKPRLIRSDAAAFPARHGHSSVQGTVEAGPEKAAEMGITADASFTFDVCCAGICSRHSGVRFQQGGDGVWRAELGAATLMSTWREDDAP